MGDGDMGTSNQLELIVVVTFEMALMENNVSSDLIWELTRPNNSYLVKRKSGGGSQFSRDPLNLVNKHSRKYEGFVNQKVYIPTPEALTGHLAVGIQPGEKGGVTLITKKTKHTSRPAANMNRITWGKNKSNQRAYKGIVNYTAKQGYRADLRAEAIARASAILETQKPKKDNPEKKLRGGKAKKAAEKESS
ncbi:MAG: hypothetical protein M1827_005693 [Pycnora praestabilis]|nr:MAG: hypothetical protein M1827_005693 [Pycnora praestabilis]